ncbi:bifunctional polysaccharide deacetylase/glycosyltransferase family 2 protein [Dactylosporangium sp. AC04546]|uniref:bifunctional polysaccharide deacetylase/glycosyltransferase family 2 protein n=1 Tax=Dactylosporangium sp. AC04546 TaxID=2862460 RepID=UPI001EDCB4EC|nr:bifunctional polysaccharide deacetylase/glycosyltransferase family 2 protein [Dactylosporangium sp. AC04546]WVK79200.1 bifunctional polysaccharide deacetylase/glycosyltransferase family 2 protein [Dactylosporangium sp. AC04546]
MTVYRGSVDPATSSHLPAVRRRRRALRLLLAVVVLALIANLLLVEAYANSSFAPDQQGQVRQPGGTVPAAVHDGGPVLDATGSQVRSYRVPERTVALTFDDGPDPTWTPRILEVLRRHQVHATFFVVGSQVARYPDLTRRLVAEGHEVGAHTFSHPQLTDLPGWRRDLEHSQTQMLIAYATGRTTSLLRPPYSSFPDALDDDDWSTVQETARQGYVTVLNDLDSRDWARPGVDAIVRGGTPEGRNGAIVLFHDAGGDRAQTVAALDRLIPQLQQRGYRFTTVSDAVGGALGPVNQPARAADVWRGRGLTWAIHLADATWWLLWALLLAVGVLTVARALLLLLFAVRHARRRRAPTWSWGPPVTEPVTIVVPAFNERTTIEPAVRSLALSAHRDVEVILVDDASSDGTAEAVEALGLDNVRVVRVPPGGKATALNTGVALSRNELVVMVDADTVVEPDAVHRLVQPFADPRVGAVAGNVKVGNRRGLLGKWQHIEYVIGFNLDRRLYDTFGCIPTIPGALGAFRRQALTDAGGLTVDTIAEDTDLTMAIHRAGWQVVYQESARAYTEAPASLSQLWMQRYRWSYGTMQALWKHRGAIRDSGASGRFGRRALPFIALFSVLLPLLAPLLDIMAVYGTFFLDETVTVVGWLAMLVIHVVTAILAFRLDREPMRPLWTLPLQQLVYRQVMYLVLLYSAITAVTGRRLRWQKLRRTGEVPAPGAY